MRFYALPACFIIFVNHSLLRLFCCIIHFHPIASLYTAIHLADVLTASDMRMREKLRHKGNPKNLLCYSVQVVWPCVENLFKPIMLNFLLFAGNFFLFIHSIISIQVTGSKFVPG